MSAVPRSNKYYGHSTQQYKRHKICLEVMQQRYVKHVPARHFKIVRYYGFLANRKLGPLLSKMYDAEEMTVKINPKQPEFTVLMKGFL
ncbi:TPA: transposase [Serratia marcescens]|nr:transposase [Serratia marcescens]